MECYEFFNKRNVNKRIEVRRYKDGHYVARQYMKFDNGVINLLGDGCLHRWTKKNLAFLLTDYSINRISCDGCVNRHLPLEV